MLGELMRRSFGGRSGRLEEFAFQTTTFSLHTDVPRPDDRRLEQRVMALLPMARLLLENGQDLGRVRNISAGGVMVETTRSHPIGDKVQVEFSSNQRLPGEIVWTRDTSCGVKFDQDIDLRELLANRPTRGKGQKVRPPRLDISCKAELLIDGVVYRTEVRDISLGGIKVAISDWNCVNKSVRVTLESLKPVKGVIRWYKAGHAGIVFDRQLSFEDLAEWMGKRVEVASLKAGAWTRASRY